jgi:hypothetical protein
MLPFRSFCFCLCFLLSALVAPTFGQQPTASIAPPVRRDPQAVSAIQTALQSLGGSTAWTQVQDAVERGSCTDNSTQVATSSQFTWTVRGYDFRYESSGSGGAQNLLVSGHGKPTRSDGTTTKPLSLRTATLMLPYQLPGMVLAQAFDDATYSLRYAGSGTWNQAPAIEIEVMHTLYGRDLQETEQTWYLTPQTMQPVAVTFLLSGEQDADHYAQLTYGYSQYQSTGGLSVPQTIATATVGTGLQQQCMIQAVQFNTGPASSSFDLPLNAGGQN